MSKRKKKQTPEKPIFEKIDDQFFADNERLLITIENENQYEDGTCDGFDSETDNAIFTIKCIDLFGEAADKVRIYFNIGKIRQEIKTLCKARNKDEDFESILLDVKRRCFVLLTNDNYFFDEQNKNEELKKLVYDNPEADVNSVTFEYDWEISDFRKMEDQFYINISDDILEEMPVEQIGRLYDDSDVEIFID